MKTWYASFDKWASQLPFYKFLAWTLTLGTCGILSNTHPVIAAVAFVLLMTAIVVCVRRHSKKIITGLLICSLLYGTSAQSAETNKPPVQPQPEAVDCSAVVFAGVIVIVGGVVVYQLIKFCKKHFPPPPTTPPPEPPPTPCPTNSPPSTNHVKSASSIPPVQPAANVIGYDISTMGWLDNTDTNNPVLFQEYLLLKMEASSNLGQWTNYCTIGVWVSSNSVETVAYDWQGQPVATNWTVGNPYTTPLVDRIPMPVVDQRQKYQFFRWQ